MKRTVVLCLVAVLSLGLFSGAAIAEEKVIKIGTLFPLTGPVALAGQRCKAAVETAVEVINNAHPEIQVPLAAQEGVLDGYKFVLVHARSSGKNRILANQKRNGCSIRKGSTPSSDPITVR